MKYFIFQWPWMFSLLLLSFPLAAVFARARRKRADLIKCVGGGTGEERGKQRDLLRLAALCLLVLGLARPGFDPERRSLSQSGRDVLFAIDVSRSMLAKDAQPSRLEAAKQGVRDALELFQTERVGVVIYAGSSSILCPLTHDYSFVRYMLDQANPRAVDFGGTTLLSAVEKSVDNVFSDGRKSMQDIVVLTDGEDHGPDMERVAKLLEEHGVDMLLVGIGDPTSGSRIPIENEEGGLSYLKHEDQIVYSRLNDEGLRSLASRLDGTEYVAPGTAAFDLGSLYAEYVDEKPISGSVGEESYVVYREAGIFLALLGFLLFFVADRAWRALSGLAVGMLVLMFEPSVDAEEFGETESRFEVARQLQIGGQQGEAIEAYSELEIDLNLMGATPGQSASIRFNQGLCHLGIAQSVGESAPADALVAARQAQRCFLEAKRMYQDFKRAGQRLDLTARLIVQYEEAVREQQEQEEKMNEQIQALIERLETLRNAQELLRSDVLSKDPKSPKGKKQKGTTASAPVSATVTAVPDGVAFGGRQIALLEEGQLIETFMESIDASMTLPNGSSEIPVQSLMQAPLKLMGEALNSMEKANGVLDDWMTWKAARVFQQMAISKIDEILEMLAGNNSSDSSEDDYDDYEDEWDMDDYDESNEGMSSSMQMEGDMAAGSEMQALPVPNYSMEEVLMDESSNLQFRQQQRSKANSGKVKKDW